MPKPRRKILKPVRIVQGHKRLFLSAVIGVAVFLALPGAWPVPARILVGWDSGVVFFLFTIGAFIMQFDLKRVRVRAADTDEGALFILMLTIAASVASLVAIAALLGPAKTSGLDVRGVFFALAVTTIMLSWCFIHFIFALHYAHEFYGTGAERGGGLLFPGPERKPDYWDFVYFSFVVGMTFQVSDVQVTSRRLRHLVVTHGIVSFLFSAAILALAVNIGSNLI